MEVNNCQHESQVSEGGEVELHSYFTLCTKNPGHKNFIPVELFNLQNLPEKYRDKDLLELITFASSLTVSVSVKGTSPNRPKLWPNSKVTYPFSDMIGSTHLRTGSGRVSRVYKYTDDVCTCRKCRDSNTQSQCRWKIHVYTATHVVFDEVETGSIDVRFFYDSEGSPAICLDNLTVESADIATDRCELTCVTCDRHLGLRLFRMWAQFVVYWKRVYDRYHTCRDECRLVFMASHPHGCAKQISIGEWASKTQTDDYYKFTYTTCTCPGCSGASVYCVGYGWLKQPVHSGTINSEINYSGLGAVY